MNEPPIPPAAVLSGLRSWLGSISWLRESSNGQIRLLAFGVISAVLLQTTAVHAAETSTRPILERHTGIPDERLSGSPTSEEEQIVVKGWPMYRTERGQEAFNHAMATLRATEGKSPRAEAFRGCEKLRCPLSLPALTDRGWIPAGRLWVSPSEYILIVHSPRNGSYDPGSRRSRRSMRYFIFHEFQNSTGNTDLYDTISAHRHSVFVPFYLGKPGRDAMGRGFVVVVQVAPHDIVSRHASNLDSAGPGIEVAKNSGEDLDWLQAAAGILVATIVKKAEPHLRVVNHRNTEGLPMLRAYQRRLAAFGADQGQVRLPFVAAKETRIAAATGSLRSLIARGPVTRTIPDDGPTAATKRPLAFAAAEPQLVLAPQLVRIVDEPVLTMERLLQRVMLQPISNVPQPQPACRKSPAFVC